MSLNQLPSLAVKALIRELAVVRTQFQTSSSILKFNALQKPGSINAQYIPLMDLTLYFLKPLSLKKGRQTLSQVHLQM